MLPDPLAFLNSIPSAFHVEAMDAEGVWHDAVKLAASYEPESTDYGIARRGEDSIFVVSPFPVPRGRITFRLDGLDVERRIVEHHENPIFTEIVLGENA